ncbi:MAG: PIN domain-containing protein [Chloroflexi bacterium]|nr:PIN domain-containing protein [Chloroflexota bacterium]
MKEETVDSNVLIAALLKQDRFNVTAYAKFQQVIRGNAVFHASRLVPVEVCGAINRRVGSADAGRAQVIINSLIRKENIRVCDLNESRMYQAADIALKHNLKGADAVVMQIAQELKLPMISYDEDVNKAARSL